MHPNRGWHPQQPPQGYGPPQAPGPGYGPPGHGPVHGYGAPGWGPQRPPSTAPAYLVGGLWVLVSILCFVLAGLNSADGKGVRQTPEAAIALLGMAFPRSVIGNGDPAIVATYVAGGVVLLLAGLLFARLGFARWVLAALGFVITGYYVYVVVRILTTFFSSFAVVPAIALVLWLVATFVSVLPAVGRAMR